MSAASDKIWFNYIRSIKIFYDIYNNTGRQPKFDNEMYKSLIGVSNDQLEKLLQELLGETINQDFIFQERNIDVYKAKLIEIWGDVPAQKSG